MSQGKLKKNKSEKNKQIDNAVKKKSTLEKILDEVRIIKKHVVKNTRFNEEMKNMETLQFLSIMLLLCV